MRTGVKSYIYLTAMAMAIGAYFSAQEDLQAPIYQLIALVAAAVMLVGTLRARPAPMSAWLLIGMGVLASAGGEVLFGTGQSVPSPADMLYISSYPLLALGLSGLVPWRSRDHAGVNVVVALAVAASIAVVCWAFLIVPGSAIQSELASQIISIGYPVMDAGLILLLIRAHRRGVQGPTMAMLGIALVCMLVADAVYAMSDFGNGYALGNYIDVAWLMSYGFFGAAIVEIREMAYGFSFAPIPIEMDLPDPDLEPLWGEGNVAVATRTRRQILVGQALDLQFALIVSWTGRILIGLGLVAVAYGASLMTPSVVLLGGAYTIIGLVSSVIGTNAARA